MILNRCFRHSDPRTWDKTMIHQEMLSSIITCEFDRILCMTCSRDLECSGAEKKLFSNGVVGEPGLGCAAQEATLMAAGPLLTLLEVLRSKREDLICNNGASEVS